MLYSAAACADVLNVDAGSYQPRVIHVHREWTRLADTVFVGPITIR